MHNNDNFKELEEAPQSQQIQITSPANEEAATSTSTSTTKTSTTTVAAAVARKEAAAIISSSTAAAEAHQASGSMDTSSTTAAAAAASATNTLNGVSSTSSSSLTIEKSLHTIEQLVNMYGFDWSVCSKVVEELQTSNLHDIYEYILSNSLQEDKGGPIIPKSDCPHLLLPHVKLINSLPSIELHDTCDYFNNNNDNNNNNNNDNENNNMGMGMGNTKIDIDPITGKCPTSNNNENWICLHCGCIRCSRYSNGHGLQHYEETKKCDNDNNIGHCLALSLGDLSVWCYECNSYLTNPDILDPLIIKMQKLKFGDSSEHDDNDSNNNDNYDQQQQQQEEEEQMMEVEEVVVATNNDVNVPSPPNAAAAAATGHKDMFDFDPNEKVPPIPTQEDGGARGIPLDVGGSTNNHSSDDSDDYDDYIELIRERQQAAYLHGKFFNTQNITYPQINNLKDMATYIKSDNCQSILILAGAGMSVASGIPDFRSIGTGLYSTLKPDVLTTYSDEEIYHITHDPSYALTQPYFLENQLPCLEIMRPFILGCQSNKWKATIAHRFVQLLHTKTIKRKNKKKSKEGNGNNNSNNDNDEKEEQEQDDDDGCSSKLTRLYTQNIDGLEYQCAPDLPPSKVITVHGNFHNAECAMCGNIEEDYDKFCNLIKNNIKDITKENNDDNNNTNNINDDNDNNDNNDSNNDDNDRNVNSSNSHSDNSNNNNDNQDNAKKQKEEDNNNNDDDYAPDTSTPIPCSICGYNAMKPSIVLFRSNLPEIFFKQLPKDLPNCDLLIVIGTSLTVAPANTIVFRIPPSAIRMVVNNEPVGRSLGISYKNSNNNNDTCNDDGDKIDDDDNHSKSSNDSSNNNNMVFNNHATDADNNNNNRRDFFAKGFCDEVLLDLICELGWLDDLAPYVNDLPDTSKELLQRRLDEEKNKKQQ